MSRLLLVEDDAALRTGLTDAFRLEGFDVTAVGDGLVARQSLFTRHFDVVVLDLMLPGRSGLELLRELRREKLNTPVLVLTARVDESDRVLGLELGADDYVCKPFSLRELVARVRALLRRATSPSETKDCIPPVRFRIGAAEIDLGAFEVRHEQSVAVLSRKEAAMLALLFARTGSVVSRNQFLQEVWDGGEHVGNRTIDTHMLNLRQKIEADPAHPRHLLTVHGVGYRLLLEAESKEPGGRET